MVDSTNTTDPFKPDSRGGIEIRDMALLPDTEAEFEAFLSEKVPLWTANKVRSLQIRF